jgi:REP element-mobilizing transposase RayT
MPNYRRVWIPGGTYFFTVALADRRSTLLTTRIAELRTAFHTTRKARPFTTDAIVVLPDHIHAIWTLPSGDADYATRWAHVKATFSRALPASERASASRVRKRERGIWQRRYWARAIVDEKDFCGACRLRTHQSRKACARIVCSRVALVELSSVCARRRSRANVGRDGRLSSAIGGLKPTLLDCEP